MNGRFLLDTNIVIALFRGDPAIDSKIANAMEVFVPSIVLGELYFGAANSQHAAENIDTSAGYSRRPLAENLYRNNFLGEWGQSWPWSVLCVHCSSPAG